MDSTNQLKTELESETAYVEGMGKPIFSLLIEKKEGIMKADMGDWITPTPDSTDKDVINFICGN